MRIKTAKRKRHKLLSYAKGKTGIPLRKPAQISFHTT
jgi:hypothetical protein